MNIFANPTTYLILLALAVTCTAYAYAVVRPLRRKDREHGQTALLVVIGDGCVALAAVLIVAVNGPVDATGLLAVLIACLVAGGLPMIAEYISDHTSQRQAQRHSQSLADVARLLEE